MASQQRSDSPYQLPIQNIIGFNGSVRKGFQCHKDELHVVYPLGCDVVIERIKKDKQDTQNNKVTLKGHTDHVTCIALSPDGTYIASGQSTHMGFKADIIIWDYENRCLQHRLVLHKVKVQDLAFSPSERYLVSVGGPDDGSVFVWDVQTGDPICGNSAQVKSAGNTLCVAYSKIDDHQFVTGGDRTLRVWNLDPENRKVLPQDVNMGSLGRIVTCLQMADDTSDYFFAGTTSGDIVGVNIKTKLFQFSGPEKGKDKFHQGVISLAYIKTSEQNQLYVGAGDGEVAVLELREDNSSKNKKPRVVFIKKKSWKDKRCSSAVTSIALKGKGHKMYIGTANSQAYGFLTSDFTCSKEKSPDNEVSLIQTSGGQEFKDVIFAKGIDELIITAQFEKIRIWEVESQREAIRYTVPNMTCNALCISNSGRLILTAWSDGTMRGFAIIDKPASTLKEVFAMKKAHSKEVTAIALNERLNNQPRIISGGEEGHVRVWTFNDTGAVNLEVALKEHNGKVSDIKIHEESNLCVSASVDGSCIIWNLDTNSRKQIVFSNTLFQSVCFGLDGVHIITGGSDRKIAYWDVETGGLIRELEGSKSGSINAIDISSDCQFIVTGGDDGTLKLWHYEEGKVVAVGKGHSNAIVKVRISASKKNKKIIVSISRDGCLIFWDASAILSC